MEQEDDYFSSEEDSCLSLPSGDTLSLCSSSSYRDGMSTTRPEIVNCLSALKDKVDVVLVKKAIEIYYELCQEINTKSIKGTRKACMIFYCLFLAYDRLGHACDPAFIADIVGLPRKKIEKAFSELSPIGCTLYDPLSFIKFYISRYNALLEEGGIGIKINDDCVHKSVEDIIIKCNETVPGSQWIENSPVKVVAVACIYFYLTEIKGISMTETIDIFSQACYLSFSCIKRYSDQVSKYYNMNSQSIPDLNNKMHLRIKSHF